LSPYCTHKKAPRRKPICVRFSQSTPLTIHIQYSPCHRTKEEPILSSSIESFSFVAVMADSLSCWIWSWRGLISDARCIPLGPFGHKYICPGGVMNMGIKDTAFETKRTSGEKIGLCIKEENKEIRKWGNLSTSPSSQ